MNRAGETIPARDAKRAVPRLGFLGVGWIGLHRLRRIAQSGAAEVVALCDPVADAASAALKSAPGARLVSSYEELLGRGLDGVVLATPSAFHAEQAIIALQRGIPVFCQKPLGRNLSEAVKVVAAARAANRLLGIDLPYRYCAAMRQLRERVLAGELGEIFAVNLVFHNAYGPDKAWFYDPELTGGGCVIDLGIHLIDLAMWTLRFPNVVEVTSQLYAEGRPFLRNSRRVEDYAVAQLVLDSGASVQLACSWKLPAGCDAIVEVSFYGTRGGASFRNVNGSFFDFAGLRFHGNRTEVFQSPPDDWFGRAAVAWAAKLGKNRAYSADIEGAIAVASILDAIYESRRVSQAPGHVLRAT